MKNKIICDTCNGSGCTVKLLNYAYYMKCEEPIFEHEDCEDCGGTGINNPCSYDCQNHVTHPCEKCGKQWSK